MSSTQVRFKPGQFHDKISKVSFDGQDVSIDTVNNGNDSQVIDFFNLNEKVKNINDAVIAQVNTTDDLYNAVCLTDREFVSSCVEAVQNAGFRSYLKTVTIAFDILNNDLSVNQNNLKLTLSFDIQNQSFIDLIYRTLRMPVDRTWPRYQGELHCADLKTLQRLPGSGEFFGSEGENNNPTTFIEL